MACHYNPFDIALRKSRSARVARASLRIQRILRGTPRDIGDLGPVDRDSLDYVLSDSKTEQAVHGAEDGKDAAEVGRAYAAPPQLGLSSPADNVSMEDDEPQRGHAASGSLVPSALASAAAAAAEEEQDGSNDSPVHSGDGWDTDL